MECSGVETRVRFNFVFLSTISLDRLEWLDGHLEVIRKKLFARRGNNTVK